MYVTVLIVMVISKTDVVISTVKGHLEHLDVQVTLGPVKKFPQLWE